MLYAFIRGAETLRKQGDLKAIWLYGTYNKVTMPDMPHLTDQDIEDIIQYVQHRDIPAHELLIIY